MKWPQFELWRMLLSVCFFGLAITIFLPNLSPAVVDDEQPYLLLRFGECGVWRRSGAHLPGRNLDGRRDADVAAGDLSASGNYIHVVAVKIYG